MSFGDLIDSIEQTLEKERGHMNNFSSSMHSMYSSARKIAGYIEQLEVILKRVDAIFQMYQMNPNNKLTTTIINNLLIEMQFIQVASNEMDTYLEEIRREQGIQTHISGKLLGIRKDISKAVLKATAIINNH